MKHFKTITVAIFSLIVTLVWADKRNLSLILAVDDSGSMKPIWQGAMNAVYSIIDALEIDDKVYPVAFSTYARTLGPQVVIRNADDKLRLRRLYSQLSPTGQWTFFADLVKVAQEIASFDTTAILICITDAISDPGPGRKADIDINQLTELRKNFPGGGIHVIRLIKPGELYDTALLERLRDKGQEFKKPLPVIQIDANDARLIDLCWQLVGALKQSQDLALKVLESYSRTASNSDTANQTQSKYPDETSEVESWTTDSVRTAAVKADSAPIEGMQEPERRIQIDSLLIAKTLPVRQWFNRNWRLLALVVISAIFVIGIAILIKRGLSQDSENKGEDLPILTPENEPVYHLIVNSDSLKAEPYPLPKNLKKTLGTDIPLFWGTSFGIGTVLWNDDGIFLEPMTDGLFLNQEPIEKTVKIKPGDVIRYKSAKITLSTEPICDTEPAEETVGVGTELVSEDSDLI